jgi:phage repressor protein C with HTH and peptisase S24 domain
MNDVALSLAAVVLLVASSTTGAVAASRVAVNHGSSMEPTLCDGSILLVDRGNGVEVGDVVAIEWNGTRTYHRVIALDGDDVITEGDNSDNPDWFDTTGTNRTPDRYLGGVQPVARPHRSDVLGIVDRVLYDGCGPL